MEKAPAELEAMAQPTADWALLDPYVYRRDDEEAFPDESTAPLRASSCTSLGQKFQVAFLPANPPALSRFYVCWPGGTKPEEGNGTDIVDTHKNLVLLRLTSIANLKESPYVSYVYDHFVCVARSVPEPHLDLFRLPECKVPLVIPPCKGEVEETVLPHVFFPNTVGITKGPNSTLGESVVVAQLVKVSQIRDSPRRMEAEVCIFRSLLSVFEGDCRGIWEVNNIPINHRDHEYSDLWYWSTDAVFKYDNYIYWVDLYRGGILSYPVTCALLEGDKVISYHRLDIGDRPTGAAQCKTLPQMNRTICVTTWRSLTDFPALRLSLAYFPVLRFVDVVRSDKHLFGQFELGSGFNIKSSHLFPCGPNPYVDGWYVKRVDSVTSHDLWASNTADLPHEMLLFPVVSPENGNIVHFLMSHYVEEEEEEIKKISVVTVNMSKKAVLSVNPYIEGGEDAYMIKDKFSLLKGLIPSTFPRYLKTGQGIEEEEEDWRHTVRMMRFNT